MVETNNSNYFELLDSLPNAFAYHRLIANEEGEAVDFVFIYANKAYGKIIELPVDEIIGKKISEVVPDIKKSNFNWISKCTKVAITGEPVEFEQYLDAFNGWFQVNAYTNEARYFAVVFQDITERKQTEEEMKKREDYLSAIFKTTQDGLCVFDVKGKIKDVNGSFCKMVGYAKEELQGLNIVNVFCDMKQDEIKARIKRIIENGSDFFEKPIKRKDGSTIDLEISVTYLNANGGIFVCFGRDITDRKKLDKKIRYLSFHDSLTGLYNRAYLQTEMQRLDTHRQLPISIIMTDVNGLKLINDTYGHSVGDEAIKRSADAIKESCRTEDIVARWGGDEFLILLPQTSWRKAEVICNRIINKCKKVRASGIPVSMAAGLAVKEDKEAKLVDVLKQAEENMYKHKLAERKSARGSMLSAMLNVLKEKGFETEEHIERMQLVANKIGTEVGLSENELSRLNLLISLHDIGKINISAEVLKKKEALTQEEIKRIKEHPEIGYRIVLATEEFVHVANEILSHHEWWDGSGYPRGLNGKDIPLLARIASIVDAYEVMSHGRPYKNPMPKEAIIEELKRYAGKQFDPVLVDVFLEMLVEQEIKNTP